MRTKFRGQGTPGRCEIWKFMVTEGNENNNNNKIMKYSIFFDNINLLFLSKFKQRECIAKI